MEVGSWSASGGWGVGRRLRQPDTIAIAIAIAITISVLFISLAPFLSEVYTKQRFSSNAQPPCPSVGYSRCWTVQLTNKTMDPV